MNTLSRNNNFSLREYLGKEKISTCELVIFNLAIIIGFWIIHSIMARSSFKKFMIDVTGGVYNYYDRGMYVLMSAVTLTILLYLYQPIDVVLYDCGKHPALFYVYIVMQLFGLYMFLQTSIDQWYCDFLGFDHYRHFKKEGTEFPMPFTMKHMSRVAWSCRHPLMTFYFLLFITGLGYGEVTLGRFIFVSS